MKDKIISGVVGALVGLGGATGIYFTTPLPEPIIKTEIKEVSVEIPVVKTKFVTDKKGEVALKDQIKGLEESIAAFRADRQNLIDKISLLERELAIEKNKPPVIKEVTRIVTVDRIVPIVRIVTTTVPTIDVFGKYCEKHPTSIICKK